MKNDKYSDKSLTKQPYALPEEEPQTVNSQIMYSIAFGLVFVFLFHAIPVLYYDFIQLNDDTSDVPKINWTCYKGELVSLLLVYNGTLIAILIWVKPDYNKNLYAPKTLNDISAMTTVGTGAVLGVSTLAIISFAQNFPSTYPILLITIMSLALMIALNVLIGAGVTLPKLVAIKYNEHLLEKTNHSLEIIDKSERTYGYYEPNNWQKDQLGERFRLIRHFSTFNAIKRLTSPALKHVPLYPVNAEGLYQFSAFRRPIRASISIIFSLALSVTLFVIIFSDGTYNKRAAFLSIGTFFALYVTSFIFSFPLQKGLLRGTIRALHFTLSIFATSLIILLFFTVLLGADGVSSRVIAIILLGHSLVITNIGMSWWRMGAVKAYKWSSIKKKQKIEAALNPHRDAVKEHA